MKGEGMDKVREALAELVAATDPAGETSAQVWLEAWAAAREALSVQPAEPDSVPWPTVTRYVEYVPAQPAEPATWRAHDNSGMRFPEACDLSGGATDVPQPAPSVPAVPEGWQLVPKEPTDAMIDATYHGQPLSDIWHDMLAAAPHPAAKGGAE